jgi:hypothetical protein
VDKSTVQRILQDATEVLDAAGIEKDLRSTAFEKAVDLLAGTPRTTEAQGSADGAPNLGSSEDPGDKAKSIAKKMHIGAENIPYVYELDDDVSLAIKRSVLAKDKAGATQEVALLYAAARQAGGYDETHTRASAIRERAESMGVLDATNFASHLTSKTDWFTHKGKGANREFKVTTAGYDAAGELVVKIRGSK